MTIPSVSANITIRNDCSKCCPRRLHIFSCCTKPMDEEKEEKVEVVAHKALKNDEKPVVRRSSKLNIRDLE